MIFGLNALSGRTIGLDGLAAGAWNSSDAESLIRYSANKGYTIHGWELRALIFSFSHKITKMFAKFLRNVVPISLLNT